MAHPGKSNKIFLKQCVSEFLARHVDLALHEHSSGLCLIDRTGKLAPLQLDYHQGAAGYRNAQAAHTDPLAKAIRIKGMGALRVWDLTGGLGHDAYRLACLGHQVTVVEQHPLLAALIQTALSDAKPQRNTHIKCHHANAMAWCKTTKSDAPHVVYLDPMFPNKRKTAGVNAKAQWLQHLTQTADQTTNDEALLAAARQHAIHKVVVKRPVRAKAIALPSYAPTGYIQGQSTRFDLYAPWHKTR